MGTYFNACCCSEREKNKTQEILKLYAKKQSSGSKSGTTKEGENHPEEEHKENIIIESENQIIKQKSIRSIHSKSGSASMR